jgi:predicted N-formylglutamate amidohydrolase
MIAAYNSGSIMARTLESLEPGTPVFAGPTRVATVTAVYAEGDARSADVLVAHWDALTADVMIPSSEVQSIDERGVHLMRQESDQYADLAPFDPARFPTLKKLK